MYTSHDIIIPSKSWEMFKSPFSSGTTFPLESIIQARKKIEISLCHLTNLILSDEISIFQTVQAFHAWTSVDKSIQVFLKNVNVKSEIFLIRSRSFCFLFVSSRLAGSFDNCYSSYVQHKEFKISISPKCFYKSSSFPLANMTLRILFDELYFNFAVTFPLT